MQEQSISTAYIRLDTFLKLCGVAETGGNAKIRIQAGEVKVNGAVCTQRGRKLHSGDVVSLDDESWLVSGT